MNRSFVLLLTLVACSKKTEEPPRKEPVVTIADGALELVSPGAEPRRVLRYALPKGTKSTIELAVDVDMQMNDVANAIPTMVMTMEIGAEDVLPDGKMKVRSTVTQVTGRDRPGSRLTSDAIAQQAMLLNGISVLGTLAPNGSLTDAHLDFGTKQLPEQMQQQLGSLTKSVERVAVALPDQPVGVGAVWRTKKTVEESGAHVDATTTFELTAIDANRVSFKRTAEVKGPDQTVTQQGISIDMKNISGAGSGHGTLDLARMAFDGEMTDELHDTLVGQGQTMTATMKMKSTYKLQGAQSAP